MTEVLTTREICNKLRSLPDLAARGGWAAYQIVTELATASAGNPDLSATVIAKGLEVLPDLQTSPLGMAAPSATL